jgi:hypothetical protein
MMEKELNQEALDALDEFDDGIITFTELKDILGPDAAAAVRQHRNDDPESFFDDPESF